MRNLDTPTNEVADRIVAAVKDGLKDIVGEQEPFHDPNTTPACLEGVLWFLWGTYRRTAAWEEPRLQERIVDVLRELKTHGKAGFEGMKIWGHDMNWNNLPVFGLDARESLDVLVGYLPGSDRVAPLDLREPVPPVGLRILSGAIPEDPDPSNQLYVSARAVWLETRRYLMRVWVAGVYDFEIYGIWFMREGLEDLDLADLEWKTHTASAPPVLALEGASVCVQTAGEKMYRSNLVEGPNGNPNWNSNFGTAGRGGKRWTGVDGYHPDRWRLWKSVFQEYADAHGMKGIWPNAVEAAKTAIAVMEKIESTDAGLGD
ncbi:uncharacterized protein PHACADRAFT_258288 [Phanerochaete carnosa HHB-10118-sp]|uniref:Uncharacterized protein n=1 Tax=Phanerochaete carnosa (strain HHB-10118-sp) TaxID=650164 RepID=K5UWL8_PHACS|nr:uncharacterized protein PHACADRAFT_258288 [Phanerochaete carnosa HHB-10118-sp]EKM54441.1 hypothetical protein PHACADRAFT_258288 [Phanerochaete carnosa HHB-10118-sp]